MLEWLANGFMLGSVIMAARNNVHTWWLGICACGFFICVFFAKKLYADVTLMVVFTVINIFGWRHWRKGKLAAPVRKTSRKFLCILFFLSLSCAFAYGSVLHIYSEAYAPYRDSLILTFSIPAQILLMQRRLETWWFWLAADTVAIPLFFERGLYLTALLYCGLWCNVWYGLLVWHRQFQLQNWSDPQIKAANVR